MRDILLLVTFFMLRNLTKLLHAACILAVGLSAGCGDHSARTSESSSSGEEQNTWTMDAFQRGDIEAIRQRALEEPDYVHERDFVDSTPLLNAIGYGDLEMVIFLIEQGADPNVEVDDGYTCLLTAIESDAEDADLVVAALIKGGADIHETGTNGWTPLHMAAAWGRVEIARMLIAAGAEVDRRTDIDGDVTPLMEAARMGEAETVALLLEHGADASLRDIFHNQTALEMAQEAMKEPDPEVVALLETEDFKLDMDDLFADMDLSADQVEMLRKEMEEFDMAQTYVETSEKLAKEGRHAEVIRILEEHAAGEK